MVMQKFLSVLFLAFVFLYNTTAFSRTIEIRGWGKSAGSFCPNAASRENPFKRSWEQVGADAVENAIWKANQACKNLKAYRRSDWHFSRSFKFHTDRFSPCVWYVSVDAEFECRSN